MHFGGIQIGCRCTCLPRAIACERFLQPLVHTIVWRVVRFVRGLVITQHYHTQTRTGSCSYASRECASSWTWTTSRISGHSSAVSERASHLHPFFLEPARTIQALCC